MRKRWTPQAEVTDSLLKFREKRKWQIALRRYVLEGHPCISYAPYFGLDIATYRKWIELQFSDELSWDNFSTAWQFDHIVPVAYFNFSEENDLFLCWNFINIRVERLDLNKNRGNRIDVLAAKSFFEALYESTGLSQCKQMIEKINRIEVSQILSNKEMEQFLIDHKEHIETIAVFGSHEMNSLNTGISVAEIKAEQELFKKFGE